MLCVKFSRFRSERLFLARKITRFCLDFSHSLRSILPNLLFCICFWLFKVPLTAELPKFIRGLCYFSEPFFGSRLARRRHCLRIVIRQKYGKAAGEKLSHQHLFI